jgi:hypothetical protein
MGLRFEFICAVFSGDEIVGVYKVAGIGSLAKSAALARPTSCTVSPVTNVNNETRKL